MGRRKTVTYKKILTCARLQSSKYELKVQKSTEKELDGSDKGNGNFYRYIPL